MIVIGEGINGTIAEDARASLDEVIDQLRAEGRLEAGQETTHETLKWTTETIRAAGDFEKTVNLKPLETLGVTTGQGNMKGNIKWTGPIVYHDVLPDPPTYQQIAPGYEVIGILALGTLQLPEIGESGKKEISSGSVAYFRGSDPVVYRSCGGGRGILFYISI
ncbi:hypothetical protein LSUE1_G004522 [Lachnellula suecica]|uniref:Uncharacterized protein n=1 Tax=Lachnellula suecica TaxID=602035 RepID=A0A8T9C5G4_9HELO|nr:hypothetical protein LSUE1_G004522 [Lachnellula suecica]